MKKYLIFLPFASIAIFLSEYSQPFGPPSPLSAGQTLKPNTNYSVADESAPDYEPPHNTRVKEPYKEIKPHLSPQVPVQLRPHSRLVLTDIEDRTFFDYFAWQTFVGLVWPADAKLRGVANQDVSPGEFPKYNTSDKNTPNRVPVVWETFQTFEAALPDDSKSVTNPPEAWNAVAYQRPFDLDLTSKGQHPVSLDEAFSSPLIDQNRQYVRYGLQMNEVMYEFIRQNKWYQKGNLPKSPTQASLPPLPVGSDGKILDQQQPQTNTIIKQPVNGNSIEIKAAWRIMITKEDPDRPWRKVDDLSRYFVSTANVSNAVTGEVIKDQLVGLVGLHIVVKTPQFTQGIWSNFEHVDNIEAPKGIRPSFHDTTSTFYPQGFSYKPKRINSSQGAVPEESRTPVEVSRIYKIPETPVGTAPTLPDGLSTVGLNKAYRKLFKGTVWQYYQLVITQWPTDPTTFYPKPFLYPRGPKPAANQPNAIQEAYARAEANATAAYPRWSALPIPQTGVLNTTMETYFQNPNPDTVNNQLIYQPLEQTSCMGCHYGASDMDYSWGLKLRTYPSPFDQGRLNPKDTRLMKQLANVK